MGRRIGTVVAILAVIGAGCSGEDGSADPRADAAVAGPEPDVSTDVVDWGDGFTHFVVLTALSPSASEAVGSAGAGADADAEAELPDRGTASSDGDPALDGALTVGVGADRRTVTFAPGDLEAVAPTAEEETLLAEAREVGMAALVVVDRAGTAGAPGARYLSLDGELRPLGGPDAVGGAVGTPAGSPVAGGPGAPVASDAEVVNRLAAVSGVVEARRVGTGVIAVAARSDADVAALEAVDGVVSVTPDVLFGLTDDPDQRLQWALRNTGDAVQAGGWPGTAGVDTGAPYAWDVATGAGVVVAVIDSGVQLDHPDLAARISTNAGDPCGNGADDDGNGFVDDCNGWDFGDGDQDPSPSPSAPKFEHGTHVAGIVAASRNGSGTVGIAPEAGLLPIKVGRSDGVISMASLVAAVQYAVARGADVVNLSLSTPPGTSRAAVGPLESVIAHAGRSGVLVVAASGNNGVDITVNSAWPASFSDLYPFVVTAGASTNTGQRASFSNHGSPVDVLAPGWFVYATWVGGGQQFSSGTSMAAPATAGAAAVVLSQRSRTPAEVREVLVGTGVPSAAGPRLDVAAAVGASRDGSWSTAYSGLGALGADAPGGFTVDVAGRVPGAHVLRMSVATVDGGQVAAVGGLTATVSGPAGPMTIATAEDGAFELLPLGTDLAAGARFRFDEVSVPAGRYAVVTELLTVTGTRTGSPQVAYLDVRPTGSVATPTTIASIASTTSTASTTSVATPVVTATTAAPVASTVVGPGTTPGSPSAGGSGAGGAGSSGPSGGGAGGPTTAPSGPAPTTTAVAGGGGVPVGPTTTAAPTTAIPTTSGPGPTTTTEPPRATAPSSTAAPAAGGGSPPVSTTPEPEPDAEGDWVLTGMDPRIAPVSGGTRITLRGRFPTHVPVYVWFGQVAVARADVAADRLEITAPSVPAPITTDVIVRFRTSVGVELRLANAFTYYEPVATGGSAGGAGGTPTGGTATTAVSSTTLPASGSGSGQGGPDAPTTLAPSPTSTTSPPATTATTIAVPGGGGSTTSDWTRTRGQLTLRPVAATSALASLSVLTWPSAGCGDACTARSL